MKLHGKKTFKLNAKKIVTYLPIRELYEVAEKNSKRQNRDQI